MPAPNTTHVVPAATLAVFIAAPSPVERPHAKRQARSSGASGSTLASAISGITVYSAKVDVPMKWRIGSPSRERRVVPSGKIAQVLLFANREAEVRAVVAAVLALTALRREQRHHMVARLDVFHALADLLDHARALVTEHRRRVARWIRARRCVEIGVADAAGDEPNERFAGLRLREVQFLNFERSAELLEDCGANLHGAVILTGRRGERASPRAIRPSSPAGRPATSETGHKPLPACSSRSRHPRRDGSRAPSVDR